MPNRVVSVELKAQIGQYLSSMDRAAGATDKVGEAGEKAAQQQAKLTEAQADSAQVASRTRSAMEKLTDAQLRHREAVVRLHKASVDLTSAQRAAAKVLGDSGASDERKQRALVRLGTAELAHARALRGVEVAALSAGRASEDTGRRLNRMTASVGTGFGRMHIAAGRAFTGLGQGIPVVGALAVGVGLLGKSVLDHAVALEQMDRKARVVLGSAFPQMEAWALRVGTRMGLTTREVLGLTAGFADMLVPMGFTRVEAAAMGQKFAALAPVLSEWSNGTVDVAGASEALMGALTGEYDTLQRLGIPISQAKVDAEVLAQKKRGVRYASIDEAEAVAALAIIYRGSVDAQRSYATSTGTLAAQTKEAQAHLKELRDQLVVKITPWFVTGFQWFNEHWPEVATGLLQGVEGMLRMGQAGLYAGAGVFYLAAGITAAAAASAIAKGDYGTFNRLMSTAGGFTAQARNAQDLAGAIGEKAIPAVQDMAEEMRHLRDRKIRIEADKRDAETHIAQIKAQLRDPNLTKTRRARLEADLARWQQQYLNILAQKAAMAAPVSTTVTITRVQETIYRTIDLGGGRRARGVGMNAEGTPWWEGGLTWVGEHGPELVDLPRGAAVYDAITSARMVDARDLRPAGAGAAGTRTITVAPVITVYPAPGMDEAALANRVADRVSARIGSEADLIFRSGARSA